MSGSARRVGSILTQSAATLISLATAATAYAQATGPAGPLPLSEQRKLAEAAGFKIVAAPDAPKLGEAPVEFPADAVKAAAAIFVRDYNLPIYPEGRVGPKELEAPAVITAARGEAEPLSLGVHALDDLEDLTIKVVANPSRPGEPAPAVRVRYVEAAYIRGGGRGAKTAVLTGLRLRPVEPLALAKGMNRQFWIDASVPPDCPAGGSHYQIALGSKSRPPLTRTLIVKVRPFELARPKGCFIGAFCANSIVPSRATFADWKDHGVEGMLWFWSSLPWKMRLEEGKLACDFSDTARLIDDRVAAGLTGPVVIALGNDRNGHYERSLCRLYNRPLAEKTAVGGKTASVARMDDEVINAAYAEGIRQFNELLKGRKNWPEVVLLHYDEPTERLMPEATLRYKQIKQVAPNLRVYGVTMNRLAWARMLAPISDILVCNGDYAAIRELGRELGKEVWGYSSSPAAIGFGGARYNMGFRLWQYGLGSHWFWSYDFYPGSAWNEFDDSTGDANWVVAYPGPRPGEHIPTPAWEALREAWDDLRYAATLEQLLQKRTGPLRDRIAEQFAQFRKQVPSGRDFTAADGQEDFYSALPSYHKLSDMRRQLAGWIEQLLPDDS